MKVNKLQIQPHIVKADPTKENYAPKDGMVLWKIWIDDDLLTETARPFHKSDSIIELKTYVQIPIWIDGAWYVSVRRVAEQIIWYSNLEFDKIYYTEWDKDDTIFFFDARQYETEVRNAHIETEKLEVKPPDFDGKLDQSTQSLNARELRFLLDLDFPESHVAIYREPTNSKDKVGTSIIRRMEHAIQSIANFTVCDPPEKQVELRIGLDESEFSEAIWHIGKVDGKYTVYFEHRPYFPLWLQSDSFDKVLGQEPLIKEL